MRYPGQPISRAAAAAVLTFVAVACGGSHDAGGGKDAAKGDVASGAVPKGAPAGGGAPPAAGGGAPMGAPGAPGAQGTAPAAAQNPIPPGVDPKKAVATVNGAPITADRAYSVYAINKSMIEQRGRALSDVDQQGLRAQTLENIIAEELMFQAATASGMKVAPADLDARLKDIRQRAGSEENFKRMMQNTGMNEADVRTELERGLKTEMYEKSVASAKRVDEATAKQYYDSNKDAFKMPEQARVQYILLKATDTDPEPVRKDAKARAEEAQKKATGGADFAALAKQYSQDQTAAKGGDVGFFPRGVMFPKFEEYAFTLAPGTVSPVFETPKGYNVIKVVERKPESTRSFEEVKNALMLDMGRLLGQKLVRDRVNELASKAKIAVLDPAFKMPKAPQPAAGPGQEGAGGPPGGAPAAAPAPKK
jgi:peptidyl-prolyl cis-trans isomerase C